jgi:hypothetical protein
MLATEIVCLGRLFMGFIGAYFAYLFGRLAPLGVDVMGCSQLVGFPSQYPSVSMLDWDTGEPTARYWVLKMIIDFLSPPQTLTASNSSSPESVFVQSFVDSQQTRRVLVVNKLYQNVTVACSECGMLFGCHCLLLLFTCKIAGATAFYVDESTGYGPYVKTELHDTNFTLRPFAVCIIELLSSAKCF